MKLSSVILASIDKVIDVLQPRVAYATATEFAYASDCWDCSGSCQGGCDGGCEGTCSNGCYDSCSGSCDTNYG